MSPSPAGGTSSAMVPVASCMTLPEAELKRGALEVDGIRAVVVTDLAGGIHPELVSGSCGAIRVLVPAEREHDALEMLADLDSGRLALAEGPADASAAGPPDLRRRRMSWSRPLMITLAAAVIVMLAWIYMEIDLYTGMR